MVRSVEKGQEGVSYKEDKGQTGKLYLPPVKVSFPYGSDIKANLQEFSQKVADPVKSFFNHTAAPALGRWLKEHPKIAAVIEKINSLFDFLFPGLADFMVDFFSQSESEKEVFEMKTHSSDISPKKELGIPKDVKGRIDRINENLKIKPMPPALCIFFDLVDISNLYPGYEIPNLNKILLSCFRVLVFSEKDKGFYLQHGQNIPSINQAMEERLQEINSGQKDYFPMKENYGQVWGLIDDLSKKYDVKFNFEELAHSQSPTYSMIFQINKVIEDCKVSIEVKKATENNKKSPNKETIEQFDKDIEQFDKDLAALNNAKSRYAERSPEQKRWKDLTAENLTLETVSTFEKNVRWTSLQEKGGEVTESELKAIQDYMELYFESKLTNTKIKTQEDLNRITWEITKELMYRGFNPGIKLFVENELKTKYSE